MGKTILVVDNNPLMLKLMETFLEGRGHTVTCLPDGFACLDLLADFQPDIIFLDLVMPQLGGDDLCRIIRTMEPLQDCPIYIISAAVVEGEFDYQAMGADGCIAKGPFTEMEPHILEAIEESRVSSRQRWSTVRGAQTLHSRQITRELLEQNSHLKLLLDSMSQGVIQIAAERIVYLNPRAAEILDGQKHALLGAPVDKSLPRNLLQSIDSVARAKGNEPVEIAGRQVLVEMFLVDEEFPSTLVLLSDITELRKMEAVIEATNLSENIGYIFSGIRHEIGNPVNSIKMALSVLKRNLDEYDRTTILEFVERSLEEVSRIEYLLKALKNYSLYEKPVLQDESVERFLENFLQLVEKDFQRRGIELRIDCQGGRIHTDLRALHHIMLNLMTNAADAVELVENPTIRIESRPAGRMKMEIRVSDNGVGIPLEEQAHLFKPFYTSKVSGTGLGLVIVRKMVAAIMGDIRLESYPGIGTSVILTLPVAKEQYE